jgi:hypothetical protein
MNVSEPRERSLTVAVIAVVAILGCGASLMQWMAG